MASRLVSMPAHAHVRAGCGVYAHALWPDNEEAMNRKACLRLEKGLPLLADTGVCRAKKRVVVGSDGVRKNCLSG